MSLLTEVHIGALAIDRFAPLIGREQVDEAQARADRLRDRLAGGVIWNVNSTAVGGGVAEMLVSLLAYSRGAGIDTRWLVIRGDPAFFRVTKRLHHALHGAPGDGSPLGPEEREIYEQTLCRNVQEMLALLSPGDVVLLHDPQTLGMAPALTAAGARVVWRCHIGADRPNAQVDLAYDFLEPYLASVFASIYSRRAYVPARLDPLRVTVIHPSIDIFSPKNADLSPEATRAILAWTGLVGGPVPETAPVFLRADGSPGRVERGADVMHLGPPPGMDCPLVVQVSRWDPLKDMVGVLRGFAAAHGRVVPAEAHLVLAGPNVHAVTDDPEGEEVFADVLAAWRVLPHGVRRHVHLAMLPTADIEENAAMVNALQRHAAVVVQKSLREGFGLTVTEAMWKGRPVVASAVGGIVEQIQDDVNGLLVADPTDLAAFGEALGRVLRDPDLAARLGAAARERVREHFLGIRHLLAYVDLFEWMPPISDPAPAPAPTPICAPDRSDAPAPDEPHAAP